MQTVCASIRTIPPPSRRGVAPCELTAAHSDSSAARLGALLFDKAARLLLRREFCPRRTTHQAFRSRQDSASAGRFFGLPSATATSTNRLEASSYDASSHALKFIGTFVGFFSVGPTNPVSTQIFDIPALPVASRCAARPRERARPFYPQLALLLSRTPCNTASRTACQPSHRRADRPTT